MVVDDGAEGVDDTTHQIDGLDGVQDYGAQFQERRPAPLPRRRRVSFNDTNLENTWLSEGRGAGAPTGTGRSYTDTQHDLNHRNAAFHSSSGRLAASQPRLLAQQPLRGRSVDGLVPARRARSVSTQGSIRIIRNNARDTPVLGNQHLYEDDLSEYTGSDLDGFMDTSKLDTPFAAGAHVPSHLLPDRSDEEMNASAEAFYETTLARTVRRCIHHWHDLALQHMEVQGTMLQIACNRDRRTLLLSAVNQWRHMLADRRLAAEMHKRNEDMERKADRIYAIILMRRAFTHWQSLASYEVDRTALVKRRVMKNHYFLAWRDITVSNEIKSRSLGLRKWFSVWRARTVRHLNQEEMALAISEETLVQRTYWTWYWASRDRQVTAASRAKLERSAFRRLRETAERQLDMRIRADEFRNQRLLNQALTALMERRHALSALAASANDHRRISIMSGPFFEMRRYTLLRPVAEQLSVSVTRGLKAKAVSIWRVRTELSQQAITVEQQRLLRNAWTNWNDRLRSQAMIAKVDDRVILQALYRWVLAERLALFRRVVEHRIKRNILERMATRHADLRFKLEESLMMYDQARQRRLLQSGMLKLHATTRSSERDVQTAIEFHNEKLLQRTIVTWKEQSEHTSMLNRWAARGRYYCLLKSTLKLWKDTTVNAKKAKRREAYASIRRRVKLALVRRCFDTWQQKHGILAHSEQEATARYRNRLSVIGTEVFDQWRGKAHQYLEMSAHAGDRAIHRLEADTLTMLVNKCRTIRRLNEEAEVFAAENADTQASEKLKLLSRALFNIRRHQETALALQERHWRKHVRNMLLFWAEQALSRKALHEVQDPDSPTKAPGDLFRSLRLTSALPRIGENSLGSERGEEQVDFGRTQRAEEWTQFDFLRNPLPPLGQDSRYAPTAQHIATPLPGYLRTPSKRTARAKARFKTVSSQVGSGMPSTTPAGLPPRIFGDGSVASTTPAPLTAGGIDGMEALTPQITPFDRKLRAGGYGAAATPAMGSRFGRSLGFGTARTARDAGAPRAGEVHEKSS